MSNHDPARAALEKKLGKRFTDSQWDFLVSKRYDQDIETGERSLEEVAAELKEWWAVMGGGPAGKEPHGPEMLDSKRRASSDRERRQRAVSILLAKEADKLDEVVGFRETYLPRSLLPWEEVQEWIRGQAEEAGKPTWFAEVPLPTGFVIRGNPVPRAFVFEPELRVAEVPGEVGVVAGPKLLRYGTPDKDYVVTVPTVAGSTLDRLRKTADRLSRRYGWTAEQATVFVLTGEIPLHVLVRTTRAVKTSLPVASRIELSVDPVVTPEELAEHYRAVRRRMMPGRRHRLQEEKHVELALFAAERGESEPWEETLKAWNDSVGIEHPDWKYMEMQKRNFPRDMKQARERLLFPAYLDPAAGAATGEDEQPGVTVDIVSKVSGEDDR